MTAAMLNTATVDRGLLAVGAPAAAPLAGACPAALFARHNMPPSPARAVITAVTRFTPTPPLFGSAALPRAPREDPPARKMRALLGTERRGFRSRRPSIESRGVG